VAVTKTSVQTLPGISLRRCFFGFRRVSRTGFPWSIAAQAASPQAEHKPERRISFFLSGILSSVAISSAASLPDDPLSAAPAQSFAKCLIAWRILPLHERDYKMCHVSCPTCALADEQDSWNLTAGVEQRDTDTKQLASSYSSVTYHLLSSPMVVASPWCHRRNIFQHLPPSNFSHAARTSAPTYGYLSISALRHRFHSPQSRPAPSIRPSSRFGCDSGPGIPLQPRTRPRAGVPRTQLADLTFGTWFFFLENPQRYHPYISRHPTSATPNSPACLKERRLVVHRTLNTFSRTDLS